MTAQHTPGPWKQDERYPTDVVGSDGRYVAFSAYAGVRMSAEMEANARLIAAAPDLLEVLELVAGATTDDELNEYLDTSEIARFHAAITKAKGEA